MALTQKELERGGCATPDCGHDHGMLYLNPNCHPRQGVEVAYVKGQGLMRITCLVCEKLVCHVAVHE